jgi:ribosomal protein S16
MEKIMMDHLGWLFIGAVITNVIWAIIFYREARMAKKVKQSFDEYIDQLQSHAPQREVCELQFYDSNRVLHTIQISIDHEAIVQMRAQGIEPDQVVRDMLSSQGRVV